MKVTGTFIFFPMLATTLIIRLSEPLPQYFFFNTGFVSLKHLSPSVLFQSSLLLEKKKKQYDFQAVTGSINCGQGGISSTQCAV